MWISGNEALQTKAFCLWVLVESPNSSKKSRAREIKKLIFERTEEALAKQGQV